MKTLRLELLAVKHPLWDLARMGPSGLERVAQAGRLDEGVNLMLESTLTADFPDRTRVRLTLEVEYPEGTTSNQGCNSVGTTRAPFSVTDPTASSAPPALPTREEQS